jgi:hypothetical protein
MSGRYVDRAMQAIRETGLATKATLATKGGVGGGLCRLDRLCRTPTSELRTQKVCAQCGAGPSTDPPSDDPTVEITRDGQTVWLHPECKRFWNPTKEIANE